MSALTQVYREKYQKYLEDNKLAHNSQTLTLFINLYSAITSTFKWKGLPKNIPFYFPERWLFNNGLMAGCMMDGEFNMFPAFGNGQLNDYGLFESYTLTTATGKPIQKTIDEIELCRNNTLCLPSIYILNEMVTKCDNALTAVDNTLKRAAFSKIISCKTPEQQDVIMGILEGKKSFNQIAMITLNEALKTGDIDVHTLFDNKADDVLALWDVFARYRNMAYTTFGFDTIEIQKRERLTQAEGSANSEISRYSLFMDMFECRRDFADRVKEKFNFDLDVDINRNSNTVYNMQLDNEELIDNELIEISKGSNLNMDYDDENNKTEKEEVDE